MPNGLELWCPAEAGRLRYPLLLSQCGGAAPTHSHGLNLAPNAGLSYANTGHSEMPGTLVDCFPGAKANEEDQL